MKTPLQTLVALVAVSARAGILLPDTYQEMVPARDGVRLFTYGIKPRAGRKMPVAILRTPYVDDKPVNMTAFAMMSAPAYHRGYLTLMQHCRGRGRSEGHWVPFEDERDDGLALLDWIRSQPWYNGEIFLVGGSYHSSAHWAWLDTNPPDVKGGWLPIMDVDAYNASYRNGFFKTGLIGEWMLSLYHPSGERADADKSASLRDFPLADFSGRFWGVRDEVLDGILAHPRRDDPFWRSDAPGSASDGIDAFRKSTMPLLLLTGAFDPFAEGMIEMWRTAPRERLANCSFIVNAFDHGLKVAPEMRRTLARFKDGDGISSPMRMFDWFDYCRTGRPCRFAPPGKVRQYALWEERWIESDGFGEGTRRIDVPLGVGVRAWTYDPLREPPGFPGSAAGCFGGMQLQPEPDFRDDVASFVLPPAEERTDVLGHMEAHLAVTSDCDDTCFFVRVSVGKSDGKWYLLRDDLRSLCGDGSDYMPGEEKLLAFRFDHLAFRLEPGDRLRVDVASACPQFAPHGNVRGDQALVRQPKVARNSVRAEASTLTLFAE